jgi:hypothetical protein
MMYPPPMGMMPNGPMMMPPMGKLQTKFSRSAARNCKPLQPNTI